MPYLHTFQGSYEKMRSMDITADEATISDFKPSARKNADASLGWYKLNPEANAVEMIPYQADNTANTNGTWELWAMCEGNGPAEKLADISGTVGTAKISDDFTALAYDTLTIDNDVHFNTVTVSDNGGNNRVAKITVDIAGYKYVKNLYVDISSIQNSLIRSY
jgi:hypothetical protein